VGGTLDFKGVLGDINERVHFRDYCESNGFLHHFRLFLTVEDYRRVGMMDGGQRARGLMRQYLSDGGDLYVPVHSMTLQRIKDTVMYGDSVPSAELFDAAQAEALATLQLLSFPDYMRTRHGIQLPSNGLRALDNATVVDPMMNITDNPMHRTILRMLETPAERLRVENVCEDTDMEAAAALGFVATIEAFRQKEPEQLPTEAHDIVEQYMAGDSGLHVRFSQRVQQELISTPKPHIAMFDQAQKEAMTRLVAAICPGALASSHKPPPTTMDSFAFSRKQTNNFNLPSRPGACHDI